MSTNHYAEILRYQPDEYGGYTYTDRRDLPDGSIWESSVSCSREMLDQDILYARLRERWTEHFAALGYESRRCQEHDLPCEDFTWEVNSYVCDPERDPEHVDFIFYGFHEELWREPCSFCLVAWAHTTPAGLIIEPSREELEAPGGR